MFPGLRLRTTAGFRSVALILFLWSALNGQSTASLEGQVVDEHGGVIPRAVITLRDLTVGLERVTLTNDEGRYLIAAVPVGNYQLHVRRSGFQAQIVEHVRVEVGRRLTYDFRLRAGEISENVTIPTDGELIERSTTSVGHVVDQKLVQAVPLNGRYFLDLGLLVPGSVTPPQNGFGTVPIRGSGGFAINTAGNREETVNYLINGITLNNQWFNSIAFQPSISSVREFKLDNSTLSAEYGQNSGAVVNVATRSGTNNFHGELFEFFRNDRLDARNFFDFTSSEPPRFQRNLFGGAVGGPIVKNNLFFYFTYEGLRHRQGLGLNSLVLSEAERASVTDPVIANLLAFIPRANLIDSSGTPRFIGTATAPVNIDRWTVDVNHVLSVNDQLHGFYMIERRNFIEPRRLGNTIPGFGNEHHSLRQVLTINHTHVFGPTLVNEMRLGFNRIFGLDEPVAKFNPSSFGVRNGINEQIGLPQISVAGGDLNFGGPAILPAGRGDTTFVIADTVSKMIGSHAMKFGGEFRTFRNNNIRIGTGSFNFPTVADFINGTANSFSVTLGNQSSSITQNALGFFAQDHYRIRPNLTMELGLRYDRNMTPTERFDRFIVFDPATASLLRVGTHIDEIYHQNNKNFQPRVGLVWDPFKDGRTAVRLAYAVLVDQPLTSIASGRSANPPFALPLTFSGPIRLDNAITQARAVGLAPQTVDHDFNNAYLQSWNFNVQRYLGSHVAMMIGYFGSSGTHLTIRRNINQPINGAPPFPVLSASSPILPGAPLGNITQVEGTGKSSYNALWASLTQELSRGLQLNTSYTWSKSIDYNSLSLQGIVVQDSYNLRNDRGLSDYDARHRFVLSAIYELPFRANEFVRDWQLAVIVQAQSGNPVNIVTSNSAVTGVANTLRPDVSGPIPINGSVERWFDTSVFKAVAGFGSLGRNVIIGPSFINTDFSLIKALPIGEKLKAQLRAEFFNVFNHPNFGQPGNVVNTPAFGRITNTRFPTGESGSSRQVQLAVKLIY